MTRSARHRRRHRPYGGQRQAVLLSPVFVTVLVTGLAFATPREIAFSRLLPAAPALAAALWPVLPTVLLGAFCFLAMIGISFVHSDLGTPYTAAAIAAVTLAAAYASHLRLQREETLFQVRLVADAAQKVLLRPLPHRIQAPRSSRCTGRPRSRPGSEATSTRRPTRRTESACSSATYAAKACRRWGRPRQ